MPLKTSADAVFASCSPLVFSQPRDQLQALPHSTPHPNPNTDTNTDTDTDTDTVTDLCSPPLLSQSRPGRGEPDGVLLQRAAHGILQLPSTVGPTAPWPAAHRPASTRRASTRWAATRWAATRRAAKARWRRRGASPLRCIDRLAKGCVDELY